MFEKILSSVGIGSAKVKTVLLADEIERGKEIQGEVHIHGGKASQKISEIYIHIDSEFHKDDDNTTDFRDVTEPILEIKITDPIVVEANEEKVVPFSFVLPYYTPITFKDQQVTIQTEIDISFINNPVEAHKFTVCDHFIDSILEYLESRGFNHISKSGVCRHKQTADDNPTHCLQDFRLKNDQGDKLYFVGNAETIHIYVYEQDRVRHCPVDRDKDVQEQLRSYNL